MNDWQEDVEDFHRAMDLPIGRFPHIRNAELRARLIGEEVGETLSALGFDVRISVTRTTSPGVKPEDRLVTNIGTGSIVYSGEYAADPDLAAAADGVADSIYVLLGTMVEAGIDLEPVWTLVQQANMAKAGGPVRADGKRLKPEGWQPPDIGGEILRQQLTAALDTDAIPEDGPLRIEFPPEAGCSFGCCREAAS